MIRSIEEIKQSLSFAAMVMRRMPAVKVQGYICAWPKFFCDEDALNQSDIWLPPLPEEVRAMEEILEWLKLIAVEERRIVWLRSCGLGWKTISSRSRKSRSTLIRQYNFALEEIQKAIEPLPESKNRYFQQSLAGKAIETCW